MKIFTDYHHGMLYYSLHLLFEKRLGWELYRPIGTDWVSQGWWRVAEPYGNPPDTIGQYLAIDNSGYVPFKNLNGDHTVKDGVYHIFDHESNITHKAITYDTFTRMDFDYIVATHPLHNHWQGLLQHHPRARFIMQMGNCNQATDAKNILSSVWSYKPQPGQQVCYYHQEGDLGDFYYEDPKGGNKIASFVFLLPHPEIYDMYKGILKEYDMKAYGMAARDGMTSTRKELADKMRECLFGWHIKPTDGYGHLIHEWFSCGRPLITKGDYYRGQTGGLLLEDGKTCIDLDLHSTDEAVKMIRYWSIPENHKEMCRNVRKKFEEVVDYDREAKEITTFLSNTVV